jgi:hypothetical protein
VWCVVELAFGADVTGKKQAALKFSRNESG